MLLLDHVAALFATLLVLELPDIDGRLLPGLLAFWLERDTSARS